MKARLARDYQLICEEQHCLEGKLASAEIEQIFETGPEQVDDHAVVLALHAVPAHKRDTDAARQGLVHSCFVLQLGVLGPARLDFDGHFVAVDDVAAQVDFAKAPGTDFALEAVLAADSEVAQRSGRHGARVGFPVHRGEKGGLVKFRLAQYIHLHSTIEHCVTVYTRDLYISNIAIQILQYCNTWLRSDDESSTANQKKLNLLFGHWL